MQIISTMNNTPLCIKMLTIVPKASGVYSLKNLISGKEYIGCSCNLYQRMKEHFCSLRCGKHKIIKLQEDYNNGHQFIFEVLVETKRIYAHMDELRNVETWYILNRHTTEKGYNHISVMGKDVNASKKALSPEQFKLQHTRCC